MTSSLRSSPFAKPAVLGVVAFGLIVPGGLAGSVPASATSTGIEISLAGNSVRVIGHPSAPGAPDAEVTGDIALRLQGSTFIVSVDPESGGGAQLWSTDPACTPSTGSDVTEVRCDMSEAIGTFGMDEIFVGIDLREVDERGSGRLFAMSGAMETVFLGSPFHDEFYGGDGPNHFEGGAGADTFIGGAGVDVVYGGAGPDSIDVSGDKAIDEVDCNDPSSRGTDNASDGPMNKVEYDKGDRISDCGIPGAPSALTQPLVAADPVVGIPVRGSNGQWAGAGLRFAFWWESCAPSQGALTDCVERTRESDKATAQTYTPKAEDVDRVLLFVVRATNNFGSIEATSAPTTVVIEPAGPLKVSGPSFGGTAPREDVPLSVDPGWWEWGDNIAYTWVMQSCSTTGKQKCTDAAKGKITSALDYVDFTPSDDDVDRRLRLVVTGTKTFPARPKALVFTTVGTSEWSTPVKPMGKVEVPLAWRPRSTDSGYAFTNVSVAEKWVAQASKTVPLQLDIIYVGVTDIKADKRLRGLLDEAQYLPLKKENDGAILLADPDFNDNIYGYPGKAPQTLTLFVYSRLKDLDACTALVTDANTAPLFVSKPLFALLDVLKEEGCTNWRMEWSTNRSSVPWSQVESIRTLTSTDQGAVKNTIVITANRPRNLVLYLNVQGAGYDSVQALPGMPSLTWDGDIKALAGTQTTFRVWPMLASTGQLVSGAKLAEVEVYDPNGFLQSSYTWDYRKLPAGVDMQAVTITAPFTTPGMARVLVRVEDASSFTTEVYVDIPVRAPTGDFITLDGRCFTAQGALTTSCSASVSAPAERTAESLALAYPDLAGGSTLEILRNGLAHGPVPGVKGNLSYSINTVNHVFGIDKSIPRSTRAARDTCEWWNLVCRVADYFTPRKARVAVVPKAQPAIPPVVVEQAVPSAQIGDSNLLAGLTDSSGCTLIGANLGIGCSGLFDASKARVSPAVLSAANAAELKKWTGSRLISDMGGAVVVDAAPAQAVSAFVMSQAAGQLTIPAMLLGKAK